jgi:quercetin dioxygenase-like cupin family protein
VQTPPDDDVDFDVATTVALASSLDQVEPGPGVKARLLARLHEPPLPDGFALSRADEGWQPYAIPGIRWKLLAFGKGQETVTLLIDAAPGARFPSHHHGGNEECYVISGDVHTLGRRLGPGDFLHAAAGTDHGELSTEHGALVLLVVKPEDYIPGFVRS